MTPAPPVPPEATTAPLALQGRRALVTGAGTRVGQAIALALGRAGMDVAVHHFASEAGAEATVEALRALGVRAEALRADLSERAEARNTVARAARVLGGLDLVVPSAASFEATPLDTLDDSAWNRSLELNLSAPFALAHAARDLLRASRGSLVFVTCASTAVPFRGRLPYVVAKAGVRQLMRALALELAPEVRVNAVAPGTVLPPADLDEDSLRRLTLRTPLGRAGTAADVAQAVVFLAESPFITGQELLVDGGRSVAAFEGSGR